MVVVLGVWLFGCWLCCGLWGGCDWLLGVGVVVCGCEGVWVVVDWVGGGFVLVCGCGVSGWLVMVLVGVV